MSELIVRWRAAHRLAEMSGDPADVEEARRLLYALRDARRILANRVGP